MAVKKLTKRWLLNSFGIILIIVMLVVMVASYGIHEFYYNAAQQYLITRADILNNTINEYYRKDSGDFMLSVRKLIENYEYRDRLELMGIENDNKIIATSSGFVLESKDDMPDYERALAARNGIGVYVDHSGVDNTMAVTMLTSTPDSPLRAMRYVISLRKIDAQVYLLVAIIIAFAGLVIFFVILSSSFFVNSIIKPIGEINLSTKKIAQGDFKIRLEATSKDEIGELCNSINEMAKGLAESEKIKNDFISSVSHELRTPLTAIKGWGETILEDEGKNSEITTKGMGIIMSETERLSKMVEELLDFSRIQSGRFKIVREKLDVVAELSDAVLMYTQRALKEEKELIYDEPLFFAVIMGDRNRLRQVFVNIIDNSFKYSDKGAKIMINIECSETDCTVTVSDTGIGIAEEDLPNIKNKFFKGNTGRRGSGIGLAVADEIIAMHGGKLELSSKQNVGTTVKITLPLLES